jgi:hypothetical protein
MFEREREWIHVNDYLVRLALWAVVALALAGAFAWQRVKYSRLEAQHRALAMRALNAEAERDTTARVPFAVRDSIRLLGDSLAAVTRLTMQLRGESDLLDRTLKQERVANQELTARVRELRIAQAPSTGPVAVDSSGVRRASFRVDSTPYHVTADVALPAPPARGSIDLRVRFDSARLTVRSGCLPKNADGVRAARVSLLGPAWLSMVVDRSEQDPEVCNATERVRVPWLGGPEIVGGAGRVFSSSGSTWGAFVGLGGHVRIPLLSR